MKIPVDGSLICDSMEIILEEKAGRSMSLLVSAWVRCYESSGLGTAVLPKLVQRNQVTSTKRNTKAHKYTSRLDPTQDHR